MSNEWLRTLELPISIEQFRRLPRNAAFKYEYFGNAAWINPRPKYYHARLDLTTLNLPTPTDLLIRSWQDDDWEEMVVPFAAAFLREVPFGVLPDEERRETCRQALAQTRDGVDGPLVGPACFAALEQAHRAGGVLVTLTPEKDLSNWDAYMWDEPPAADLLQRRGGRAHLTWIFVAHLSSGHGVGTALLRAAARSLLELGYRELYSTFLAGNDSSLLWHWRVGFELLAHPASRRHRLP